MKVFFLLTLIMPLSLFAQLRQKPELCPGVVELELKTNIINSVIRDYQDQHFRKFKNPINVYFTSQTGCSGQMNASIARSRDESRIVMDDNLFNLKPGAIAFAICHELGHLFGKLADESMEKEKRLSLEGEADYWAGSCLQQFIKTHPEFKFQADKIDDCKGDITCEETMTAAKSAVDMFWKNNFDHKKAMNKNFEGINQFYPDGDCRLLSVLEGVKSQSRPSCWYNPGYTKPQDTNSRPIGHGNNTNACRQSRSNGCEII